MNEYEARYAALGDLYESCIVDFRVRGRLCPQGSAERDFWWTMNEEARRERCAAYSAAGR